MFEQALHLYTEYLRLEYSQRLVSGKLLADAARVLLAMKDQKLNSDQAFQRSYLMRYIASALLEQTVNMSYARQYDCVPVLSEYATLAFDMMIEVCEGKPDRNLLPFLKEMIGIVKAKKDEKLLAELKEMWRKSIEAEKRYLEYLSEYLED